MPTSEQVRPFDIWLVYLHFIDHPHTGKVRPVLVVGTGNSSLAVAKITSKPPLPGVGDIPIALWQKAGLKAPSTVRCSQVFEIAHDELLRDAPLGRLQPYDIARTAQALTVLGYFQQPNPDNFGEQRPEDPRQ
jgi:hypothetical protein